MKHGGKEKTKADQPPLRQLASTFYPMVAVKICERFNSATRVVILWRALQVLFFNPLITCSVQTVKQSTILDFAYVFQTTSNSKLSLHHFQPLKNNDGLLWRFINNSIVKEGNKNVNFWKVGWSYQLAYEKTMSQLNMPAWDFLMMTTDVLAADNRPPKRLDTIGSLCLPLTTRWVGAKEIWIIITTVLK